MPEADGEALVGAHHQVGRLERGVRRLAEVEAAPGVVAVYTGETAANKNLSTALHLAERAKGLEEKAKLAAMIAEKATDDAKKKLDHLL